MGFRSLLKRALTENDNDKFLKVEIGQVFYDRYRVETHLGAGRYASVWLVIDSTSVLLPTHLEIVTDELQERRTCSSQDPEQRLL